MCWSDIFYCCSGAEIGMGVVVRHLDRFCWNGILYVCGGAAIVMG